MSRLFSSLVLTISCFLFFVLQTLPSKSKEIDLQPYWDLKIPLENPHKGWYHHYPDNHINKYKIKEDADLLEFTGMDHLYIRLAWAYLEPEENQYNWAIIDDIINKWTQHGLKIAFRISCKETSTDRIEQQFATPKWVMEAGAEGGFYRSGEEVGPDGPWEPEFDDQIFLSKLDNFLKAFADRYDHQPWMRYIDVGSIGDWGEGHLHSGSRKHYGYEVRKKHIDMHLKHFKDTQIVISDDFVYSVNDENERKKLHQYIVDNGIGYRDDSILVDWYVKTYPERDSIRSPEFFEDVWKTRPTVLELQHYHLVKRDGNWQGQPDSTIKQYGQGKSGPGMLRGALQRLHATYIGYHGYADEWLQDNPDLTVELLNRCGYWYVPHQITIPESLQAGKKHTISIHWENKGVAPAYHPYLLQIRLDGSKLLDFELVSRNQKWLPSTEQPTYTEQYEIKIPDSIEPGTYKLKLRLYSGQEQTPVFLGIDQNFLDKENYYIISTVEISK